MCQASVGTFGIPYIASVSSRSTMTAISRGGCCATSSERLTGSVLTVGSKIPKVIARPQRAPLGLGAPSAFHGRHGERRSGSCKRLCATATEGSDSDESGSLGAGIHRTAARRLNQSVSAVGSDAQCLAKALVLAPDVAAPGRAASLGGIAPSHGARCAPPLPRGRRQTQPAEQLRRAGGRHVAKLATARSSTGARCAHWAAGAAATTTVVARAPATMHAISRKRVLGVE